MKINAVSQLCNWVPAKWVMEATGWDKRKMQRARQQRVVNLKGDGKAGYLYDLNSIHPVFFIRNDVAENPFDGLSKNDVQLLVNMAREFKGKKRI